jgi:hypothetical protein
MNEKKRLREVAALEEGSYRAAEGIFETAKIPILAREAFREVAAELLAVTSGEFIGRASQSPKDARAFANMERAINTLVTAEKDLSKAGRAALAINIFAALCHHPELGILIRDLEDFENNYAATVENYTATYLGTLRVVGVLANALSHVANKNPLRVSKKGNAYDFAFKAFVMGLWKIADDHGGSLSANCKNNEGTGSMFDALVKLRSYFPAVNGRLFIKPVLPAQTIANCVAEVRTFVRAQRT